eukprot:CAMPEP_0185788324 /NCGR_PEP_ID=MMETSP1174-20130828/145556_1 /TAXON_ID=35687 /ORGANISM="Dictyocha speculum, Strain CCMP1381" /LENGTH=48 /DNA_ID= /DNA_START= /DNA_END= /DNA_ORIENTATION=
MSSGWVEDYTSAAWYRYQTTEGPYFCLLYSNGDPSNSEYCWNDPALEK